ncbi:serine/threonine-protein kinase [Natronoglycomyces albus]|uniref:non-specific serine/threonine protein kinase n=1 Tax=Natronoglycomyces albus TaxID=2811108 RepID=A0A895XVJ8_9ACTN|nr:serine/threonine-protein kinase [Natronoglycomyces albus]QSB05668.1 serine/threonine protein kinase [Natronoglycomyces albus]
MLSPDLVLGGRYRLTARIATGGMGEIWRANDTVLDREVAVKALLPALLADEGFTKRFKAEAKMLAALTHPNIVRVYDYGEADLGNDDTTAYLVMEYVPGTSLTALIAQQGRLDFTTVLPLIAAIADALQHAHDHHIIHRDIKPSNILLRPDGTPLLTDFGIARSAATGDLTASGEIMGTAAYIAPEQAEGGKLGPSVDIYALGVVAYQALEGRRPFESDNPIELALHHIRTPAPPLGDHVPLAVRQFVEKALQKVPSARHRSAADMKNAASTSVHLGGTHLAPSAPTQPYASPIGNSEETTLDPAPSLAPGYGSDPASFTTPYGLNDVHHPYTGGTGAPAHGNPHGTMPIALPGNTTSHGVPRSRARLAGILAAVLLAATLAGGLGWYLVTQDANEGNLADTTTSEQTTDKEETPTGYGDRIAIASADYLGWNPQATQESLEGLGFYDVRIQGSGDEVSGISPEGELSADETITIHTQHSDEPSGDIGDCQFPPCD